MNSEILHRVTCFSNAFAAFSTRAGGVSTSPYSSLNLGDHVGDDMYSVEINRSIFAEALGTSPVYMQQIHSSIVREVNSVMDHFQCDAMITVKKHLPLAVMTADCLPLLIADVRGSVCAAVHCGWRSLAGGIVGKTVELMQKESNSPFQAFIGPCIRQAAFEVGREVKEVFIKAFGDVDHAFFEKNDTKLLCSLPALTKQALYATDAEISLVSDCNCDTYTDPSHFFSYRRDGITGRMVSVIGLS